MEIKKNIETKIAYILLKNSNEFYKSQKLNLNSKLNMTELYIYFIYIKFFCFL